MRPSIVFAVCLSLTSLAIGSEARAQDTEQLRLQLHERLREGHRPISYAEAYDALAQLHADPATPGNIILFYTRRSQDADLRVNQDAHDGWNREHLWPQSHGARSVPMRSDLHHLMPTDATVNGNRGSLDFDEGGRPEGEAAETFLDEDSFDPRDAIQGDIARALFYMDVRYAGTDGEPDLQLVDERSSPGRTLGHLCTLLAWHEADPPDAFERSRNDAVERIQGNRNLFIDEPELAAQLYGTACDTPIVGPNGNGTGKLRLATWNIANLWHVAGEHLRPARDGGPGLQRAEKDYDAIRAVATELDAHVIGLQEMGSPEAVRLIFPNTEWDMAFSRRLTDDLAADPDKLADDTSRDIYTAVVVRRDSAKIVGTERIELDIEHNGRPVREGTAVLVDTGELRFWAASVHLKSGCFFDNDLNDRADCRTLARQLPILEDWIDTKSRAGEPVVLLGDFNRQIDRGSDVVRQELDDQDPVDLFKVPHRQRLVCSAFRAEPTVSIDYVIMNESLWAFAEPSDTPKLDVADDRISDHCPVFVDLDLSDLP